MQGWNVLHSARCKYRTQKVVKKSPSLSGYIFATKAHIDNRKNLLSSNISSTRSHNMVNFGPLAAEIGPVVWGTPCKFQWVSRLGSVTARHSSIGRQPNFAVLNRGHHLYSAGRPSRWALAHILVFSFFPTTDFSTSLGRFSWNFPHDAVCPEIVYLL